VLDHGDQPDGPIRVMGTDTLDSRAFILTGGEYVVDYQVSAAENGDCEFLAYLIPTAEPELYASVGEVSVDAEIGSGAADQARYYAVDPGEYYWSARVLAISSGFAPCEWTLALTGE
jgi:hypothetical protein